MKKSKKLFIIIGGVILVSILAGIIILNGRESKVIDSIEIGKEESEKNEEPLNVVLANEEEQKNEVTKIEENGTLEEDNTKTETEQKKTKEPTSNINTNTNIDKQASNDMSKIVSVTSNNKTTNPEVKQETENSNKTIEQPQETNQKTEQSKPVENKPVENKPVETANPPAPVREFKVNQNYINKLRSTITTEVTNNLEQLNKYGITDVSQYQIIVDSSICTCYGGNRNGWTYENVSAYNTFKSSILKGTNMKIYAVDEYYNGEYIQTLCYYGH